MSVNDNITLFILRRTPTAEGKTKTYLFGLTVAQDKKSGQKSIEAILWGARIHNKFHGELSSGCKNRYSMFLWNKAFERMDGRKSNYISKCHKQADKVHRHDCRASAWKWLLQHLIWSICLCYQPLYKPWPLTSPKTLICPESEKSLLVIMMAFNHSYHTFFCYTLPVYTDIVVTLGYSSCLLRRELLNYCVMDQNTNAKI